MSNSNQAFIDYYYNNYYYSPHINIHHPLSSFFPRYQYPSLSIFTYPPPQSPTPTYYPMQRFSSTLPPAVSFPYDGPVEFIDEMAIILDSEDMFDPQTQMGCVNSGLSEKTISKNLKTSRYQVACEAEEQEGEVCAVCQDEYKVNEMIGTLRCGHGYHTKCIQQWLLLKNVCPICRATVSDI